MCFFSFPFARRGEKIRQRVGSSVVFSFLFKGSGWIVVGEGGGQRLYAAMTYFSLSYLTTMTTEGEFFSGNRQRAKAFCECGARREAERLITCTPVRVRLFFI